jgi:hypothetical protein
LAEDDILGGVEDCADIVGVDGSGTVGVESLVFGVGFGNKLHLHPLLRRLVVIITFICGEKFG